MTLRETITEKLVDLVASWFGQAFADALVQHAPKLGTLILVMGFGWAAWGLWACLRGAARTKRARRWARHQLVRRGFHHPISDEDWAQLKRLQAVVGSSRFGHFRSTCLSFSTPCGPIIIGRAIYFDNVAGQAEYPWVMAIPPGLLPVTVGDAAAYRHHPSTDGWRLVVGGPKVTAIRAVRDCLATQRQLKSLTG